MFTVRSNLIHVIGTFDTEAEALAFVERLRPISMEADADYPGCWDAITEDGRIISIDTRK